MNHDDTEYDDDWAVQQEPPPQLLGLEFEPPPYPHVEDQLILPDILGDNSHHDGNILLQAGSSGFGLAAPQFPHLAGLPELPPLPHAHFLPNTALNRIQNIMHDDSGQIDQNIVDSYQEITINETHLNTLIITGTHNEVRINSRHIENVIISGMNNKVVGKANFTDAGRVLKTKVKHLGISGMNNLVKNLISRDLNITGSCNKVAHVQCVNASVAQSDNQLIDCEMLEQNDTNETHKEEEFVLDNQPDGGESDPEAVEQEDQIHHFPSPPLLHGAVHHHHHHIHNANDLELLDDLPSPPVHLPFNPQQLLEELLYPVNGHHHHAHHGFHHANYDMHFDIPEADLEFELEELSRPNEMQYRNLERRIKIEKYKYKPKKNKEEEKKEKDERDACAICLVNLEHNDRIRRLPCKHLFHADCVMNWFKERMSCPVCRKDLTQLAA